MSIAFFEDNPFRLDILPPNTEAISSVQRYPSNREVGSFYVSNHPKEVEEFFDHFTNKVIVDLPLSYWNLKDFYRGLISNCSSLYHHDLIPLQLCLDNLERFITSGRTSELFFSPDAVHLTSSKKYLKIDGSGVLFSYFQILTLGDITKMTFQKISDTVILLFLSPKNKEVQGAVSNLQDFQTWLKANTKK